MSTNFFYYVVILVMSLINSSSIAQEARSTLKPENSISKKQVTRNTYAVIVGISAYKNLRPLNYADKDAELFRNFLLSAGGGNTPEKNIKMFLNDKATTGSLGTQCFEWLNNQSPKIETGDRIYFYLSGHGDGYNKNYYFFTHDADTASGPRNYKIQGNIKISDIKESLQYYADKGAEIFLIIDACRTNDFSDSGDKSRAERSSYIANENSPYNNFFTIYSTKNGMVAYESPLIGGGHGLFSYFLVQGLAGKADIEYSGDNNGIITLFELANWLKVVVPKYAKEKFNLFQVPQYCCQTDDDKNIFSVNKMFLQELIKTEKNIEMFLKDTTLQSYVMRNSTNVTTITSKKYNATDEKLLRETYNLFIESIKANQLILGKTNALLFYNQMKNKWAESDLVKEARLILLTELIDYAQSVIQLYLTGADMDYIFDKSNNLNTNTEIFQKYKRVSSSSFSTAANYLDSAIQILGEQNSLSLKLEPRLWFLRARSYFDKSSPISLKEAINLAEKALSIDTGAVHLYHLLAMLEMERNKNSKKVEEYFIKAYEGNSQWGKAGIELGYYYYQLKRFDESALYYKLGILSNQNFAVAYNNLALALKEEGKLDEAEKYFKLGIQKKPNDLILKNNLNTFYIYKGNDFYNRNMFLEAEYFYKLAVEANTESSYGYSNLGDLYSNLHQYAKARDCFKVAITQKVTDETAIYNLGVLYHNKHHWDSAIYYLNLYNKVVNNNKEKTGKSKKIIYKCKYQKSVNVATPIAFEDDLIWYKKYFSIDSALSSIEKARRFENIRQWDKSEKYYYLALKEKPDNSAIAIEVAKFLSSQEKFKEAENILKNALVKNQSDCNISIELCNLFVNTNRFLEAELTIKECFNYQPENCDVAIAFGNVYEKQNRFRDAEEVYTSSYLKSKNNKKIVKKLYDFYLTIGKSQKAAILKHELLQRK